MVLDVAELICIQMRISCIAAAAQKSQSILSGQFYILRLITFSVQEHADLSPI